jgi:hypothetical protein
MRKGREGRRERNTTRDQRRTTSEEIRVRKRSGGEWTQERFFSDEQSLCHECDRGLNSC